MSIVADSRSAYTRAMEAAGVPDERASEGAPSRRSARSGSHSGRLLLRMPAGLHAALARESEREGVSLNALITAALAEAIDWREDGSSSPTRDRRVRAAARPRARSRGISRLLLLNLLVLLAVGTLALVLLVQALR